jgi:hypothetical protein
LGSIAEFSSQEMPAVCIAAVPSISQSRANSEKRSHERLNDQPEVQGPFYAVDEVLPVFRDELTHT